MSEDQLFGHNVMESISCIPFYSVVTLSRSAATELDDGEILDLSRIVKVAPSERFLVFMYEHANLLTYQ